MTKKGFFSALTIILVFFGGAIALSAQLVFTSDFALSAYWGLSESSGSRSDSHGPNTLIESGTVSSVSAMVGNGAMIESGESLSNDGINISADTFTIGFWLRADMANSPTNAVELGEVRIYVSNGDLYYQTHSGGAVQGPFTLAAGWNYVALSANSATDCSKIAANTVSWTEYCGGDIPPIGNPSISLLGGHSFDEVAVWDRELELGEVSHLKAGANYFSLALYEVSLAGPVYDECSVDPVDSLPAQCSLFFNSSTPANYPYSSIAQIWLSNEATTAEGVAWVEYSANGSTVTVDCPDIVLHGQTGGWLDLNIHSYQCGVPDNTDFTFFVEIQDFLGFGGVYMDTYYQPIILAQSTATPTPPPTSTPDPSATATPTPDPSDTETPTPNPSPSPTPNGGGPTSTPPPFQQFEPIDIPQATSIPGLTFPDLPEIESPDLPEIATPDISSYFPPTVTPVPGKAISFSVSISLSQPLAITSNWSSEMSDTIDSIRGMSGSFGSAVSGTYGVFGGFLQGDTFLSDTVGYGQIISGTLGELLGGEAQTITVIVAPDWYAPELPRPMADIGWTIEQIYMGQSPPTDVRTWMTLAGQIAALPIQYTSGVMDMAYMSLPEGATGSGGNTRDPVTYTLGPIGLFLAWLLMMFPVVLAFRILHFLAHLLVVLLRYIFIFIDFLVRLIPFIG